MRRLFSLLTLVSALALAACAAPTPGTDDARPAQSIAAAPESAQSASAPASPALSGETPTVDVQPAAPKPRTKPAPQMSDPLPPERVPDAKPVPRPAVATLDVSCQRDADCAVKNVGNCCGMQPRCVNVNAVVDPNAVQEQCARNGMASVCGFAEINACQCVQGQCKADSGAVAR